MPYDMMTQSKRIKSEKATAEIGGYSPIFLREGAEEESREGSFWGG